tara:strand:+ start:3759 stop:4103 length:345 start_codon:yes stop_codon:yes gene_type:complete
MMNDDIDIKQDIEKNKEIQDQVERWDIMAKVVPTSFLLISLGLTIWGWISVDTAFWVGFSIFALTSVLWWFWTIFTIRHLITVLNRASKNLSEIRRDFRDVSKEVEEFKKNDKK